MKRKGFTLIELLAVIVILAIIALITIPVTLNIIEDSKKGAFEDGLYSIFDAYSYEEALNNFSDIGEKNVTSLNLTNNKYLIGKVSKINGEVTLKNVSDGTYCANGTKGQIEIINDNCGSLDETEPVIKNISYTGTTNSLTVTVSFSEPDSFIKDVKYKLLKDDVALSDWVDYDTLSGSGENIVSTKTFNNLEQGSTYKVEVKIANMAVNNNTALADKSVSTTLLNKPTISYNTSVWELSKNVTITYNSNVTNSYKILDENDGVIEENVVTELTKTLVINNYNYKVIALSTDGVNTVSETVEVGYIDKVEPEVALTNLTESNQNILSAEPTPSTSLSGYTYTWYKNDILISGATSSSYTTVEPGTYKVVLTAGNGNESIKTFTINGYNVSYNVNGGVGEIPNDIKTEHLPLTLTSIVPTKTDYTFLGWSSSSSASSAEYLQSGTYNTDADITLYAVWTPTYKCATGTLTKNDTLGASTGGYICVSNASGKSFCSSTPSCSFPSLQYYAYDNNWNVMGPFTLSATTSSGTLYSTTYDAPSYTNISTEYYNDGFFSATSGTMYELTSNGYYNIAYQKCTTSNYNASLGYCYRNISYGGSEYYGYPKLNEYWGVKLSYVCIRKYSQAAAGESWQSGTPTCSSPTTLYRCSSGWSQLPGDQTKCYTQASH